MIASTARVPTRQGSKYAAQLGKHWAHHLQVEELGQARRIIFPRDARGAEWPRDAQVTLEPAPDSLTCRIEASHPGQLEALKGAVERHVDRFAFREAPLEYAWEDAQAGGIDD